MLEQDFVKREVDEMTGTLLKLLYDMRNDLTDSELSDELTEGGEKKKYFLLKQMVDEGRIDEAENEIYELTEGSEEDNLKVALMFYSYLNEKTDDFLENNNFSREEVKQGLEDLVLRCGLESMSAIFLR